MFKNNILNAFVNQSYPIKCQILNSILEESTSKELCSSFEIIVNCIFSNSNAINYIYNDYSSSDINNNNNLNRSNIEQKFNWPLKLVNRSQYSLEYDCMFNFLNTSSPFWISIFRLDNLGATFNIECNSLPTNVRHRIENSLSFLSSKVDAFNVLSLSALEFYFVHFFLLLHDNKTNSRRLYNEQYGNIELDSVYADLLNDYLNYFLPVNDRDVNFPKFIDLSQPKQAITTLNPIPVHHRHNSLLKRIVQKSLTEDNSLSMISEPDRVSDMTKIDMFLRLLVELLINSFMDTFESLNPTTATTTAPTSGPNTSKLNTTPPKSLFMSNLTKNLALSNSPVKLNDPKQYLANIETIFALSMIVKHFHVFSNAFSVIQLSQRTGDWNLLNESRKSVKIANNQNDSPLDELRILLFKNYLRKPFYKFFQFHFEHWPFTPSIKWVIELWFTYIQPWKFINNQNKSASNATSEFIKDNFLNYSDIYQSIMKRFCIFDLTNEDNIHILHRILYIFYSHNKIINKIDYLFTNVQTYLKQFNNQECELILRQNIDFRYVINLLNECDKPLYSYKSLNGLEHLRMISSFNDSLSNTKAILNSQIAIKSSPKGNFIVNIVKSIFSTDQDRTFGNLKIEDFKRIVNSLDECINILHEFYKSHPFLNETLDLNDSTFNGTLNTENKQMDKSLKPECEIERNGLKLSPKGRYQIINRLCKPVLTTDYDPETAPIGEFENKFLVLLFHQISYLINQRFSSDFETLYNRDDRIGKISRKFLYGPNDIKNKVCLVNTKNKQQLTKQSIFKVRMSLRCLANYRFVFYFILNFLLIKLLTGYSFIITLFLVCLIFFVLNLF